MLPCYPKAGGKAAPGSRKLSEREAFVMRHFAGDVQYCVEGEYHVSSRPQ